MKTFIIDLLISVATGVVKSSYFISLAVCFIAIILYAMKFKKAGKYIPASILFYFILKALEKGLNL